MGPKTLKKMEERFLDYQDFVTIHADGKITIDTKSAKKLIRLSVVLAIIDALADCGTYSKEYTVGGTCGWCINVKPAK